MLKQINWLLLSMDAILREDVIHPFRLVLQLVANHFCYVVLSLSHIYSAMLGREPITMENGNDENCLSKTILLEAHQFITAKCCSVLKVPCHSLVGISLFGW